MAVAILEGFAWGLLFSLWWKQPLMAAVAAIACASLGTQLAIASTTDAYDAFSLDAYHNAIPGRLLICVAVLAVDLLLGKYWLYPSPHCVNPFRTLEQPRTTKSTVRRTPWPVQKMFTRLLWQTCRESWKSILKVLSLSFGLIAVLMIPAYIQSTHDFLRALPFVALIPPALLGAMAFRADQQRDHRLFLATHAVKPRYVWFARHAIWLTVVIIMGLSIQLVARWVLQANLSNALNHFLGGGRGRSIFDLLGVRHYRFGPSQWTLVWQFQNVELTARAAILTAWSAFIAAYGIGQLGSMLLKQSLLSGFLAILFGLIIATWSVLMFMWEMNPLWFVLPIGLSAMLATWLRVPAWILGKNHLQRWLAPAATLLLPLIAIVSMVPATRMTQVNQPTPNYPFLREPLDISVRAFQDLEKRQKETQLKLERLGISLLHTSLLHNIDEVAVDGKSLEDFGVEDRALELFSSGNKDKLEPEDLKILNRFELAQQELFYEQNKAVIPAALEILNHPQVAIPRRPPYFSTTFFDLTHNLATLLDDDAQKLTAQGQLDEAWQRLKAIIPLKADFLFDSDRIDNYSNIIEWAQNPNQTSERLKRSIVELQALFDALPLPRDTILVQREYARKVLLGKEPPRDYGNPLPLLLHNLLGEQARSLSALDQLTVQALNYADAVVALSQGAYSDLGFHSGLTDNPRELLRIAPSSNLDANNEIVFRGDKNTATLANNLAQTYATSFLAAEQFGNSAELNYLLYSWMTGETYRRALLVQLALMAYQLDHGHYPETLAELTPNYLPEYIQDPFSDNGFEYRPQGLEYKLIGIGPKEISADTPMIWSVGQGNVQLKQNTPEEMFLRFRHPSSPATDAVSIPDDQFSPNYELRNTEIGTNARYVFPLPKIETPTAEESSVEEVDNTNTGQE
ncbi:MAG: hypothetical protein SH868_15580 [Bythopirellula sp.]|nr:hypothetical protein [Bythopirellula sp.]